MEEANLIQKIIGFFTNHWNDILMIVTQVIGLASIIVKLTPTLKDDDVLKPIVRFLGKYIALNRSSGDGTK